MVIYQNTKFHCQITSSVFIELILLFFKWQSNTDFLFERETLQLLRGIAGINALSTY